MKRYVPSLLACLLPCLASLGQWILIDDFQQWTGGMAFTDAADIGWHAVNNLTNEEYLIVEDPHDPTNLTLYPSISSWDPKGFNWISRELPEGGIAPGEIGTLRFRVLWLGARNWYIGTTDQPAEYDPVTGEQVAPGAIDDFNALLHLNPETNALETWNGEDFSQSDPPREPQINQWYTFYMVIRNYWNNGVSPPTSRGSYTLYMENPSAWSAWYPVLELFESDFIKNWAPFRRAPVDENGEPQPINWVIFASYMDHPSTSGSGSPFLIDDFYFSKGRNVPNLHGDIDTGDWLGWINVLAEPFIFSYSLGNWFYMEDLYSDRSGAWGYFFK